MNNLLDFQGLEIIRVVQFTPLCQTYDTKTRKNLLTGGGKRDSTEFYGHKIMIEEPWSRFLLFMGLKCQGKQIKISAQNFSFLYLD